MYRVLLSRSAEKDLNKIDNQYRLHIIAALFDLRKNPYSGKRLEGKLKNFYSLRVGQYRIIYKIFKDKLNIFIIRIGHRQSIYK